MANFQRDNRSIGRDFKRPSFGARNTMHKAICSSCGIDCEVPFRPTSGRPIYCSSCFEKNEGASSGRSGGRFSQRPGNFEDKRMFDAVCDQCGKNCKIPFEPRNGKPVYCNECFDGKRDNNSRSTNDQTGIHIEEINKKLDLIISYITKADEKVLKTPVIEEKPKKVVKKR